MIEQTKPDPWALAELPPRSRKAAREKRRMQRYNPEHPQRHMAYSRAVRVAEVEAVKVYLAALAAHDPERLAIAEKHVFQVIDNIACDLDPPPMPLELR